MKETDIRISQVGGIYWILNLRNNKVYIGSTSRTFSERWSWHRRMLAQNRHNNSHLQRAWRKYGSDAFEFRVLEVISSKDDCIRAEQDWLDHVRLDGLEVYNGSTLVTASFLGKTHTQEARRKISESMQGNQRGKGAKKPQNAIDASVRARARQYPALVNTQTGQTIPAGSNVALLAKELDIPRRTLLHIISGEVENSSTGWGVAR